MAPRAPSARLAARRDRILPSAPAVTSPIAPSEVSAPSPPPTPAATNTVRSKDPDSTGAGVDKNKKKHSTTDIFGTDLPSQRLRLPQDGNLTAIEQIVFLTETLRSRDPVERILQDGMSTHLLAHIINQHRTGPKYPIHGNSVLKMLHFTMRDESKKKKEPGAKYWNFRLNKMDESKKVKKWPADKMTLAGLQADCEKKVAKGSGPIDHVPFDALLVDVAHLPEGDDALDLTRCLTWIMHNPGSGLLWPRDFQWLVTQIGGPQAVVDANRDPAVYERWTQKEKKYNQMVRKLQSRADKAEAAMQKVKTKAKMVQKLATFEEATDALHTLMAKPPALASKVNGIIVIDHLLLPAPIPGPNLVAVAEYLAQIAAPLAATALADADEMSPTGSEFFMDLDEIEMDAHDPLHPVASGDLIDDSFVHTEHSVSSNSVYNFTKSPGYGVISSPALHEDATNALLTEFYSTGRPSDYGDFEFDQPFDPVGEGMEIGDDTDF